MKEPRRKLVFKFCFFFQKNTQMPTSPFSHLSGRHCMGASAGHAGTHNLFPEGKLDDSSKKLHLISQTTRTSFCNFPCFESFGRRTTPESKAHPASCSQHIQTGPISALGRHIVTARAPRSTALQASKGKTPLKGQKPAFMRNIICAKFFLGFWHI